MCEGDCVPGSIKCGEFPWIEGLSLAIREALESGMTRKELAKRIGGLVDVIADDVERKS